MIYLKKGVEYFFNLTDKNILYLCSTNSDIFSEAVTIVIKNLFAIRDFNFSTKLSQYFSLEVAAKRNLHIQQ